MRWRIAAPQTRSGLSVAHRGVRHCSLTVPQASGDHHEVRDGLAQWTRSSEVEALSAVDAEIGKHSKLLSGLHALGDEAGSNLGGDPDHAGNDSALHRIVVHVADQ